MQQRDRCLPLRSNGPYASPSKSRQFLDPLHAQRRASMTSCRRSLSRSCQVRSMVFEGASGTVSHETDRGKLSRGSEPATDTESGRQNGGAKEPSRTGLGGRDSDPAPDPPPRTPALFEEHERTRRAAGSAAIAGRPWLPDGRHPESRVGGASDGATAGPRRTRYDARRAPPTAWSRRSEASPWSPRAPGCSPRASVVRPGVHRACGAKRATAGSAPRPARTPGPSPRS